MPRATFDSMAGPENQSLFDQFERTDSSPMEHGGNVFDFYNRVARPDWAQVRDVLEKWYSYYPDTDGDLRGRFQSDREEQHLGAWWELYIFTFYRKLGYQIAVHPELPNGASQRPDFLVTRDGTSMYVECKMMLETAMTPNEADVLNATDKVRHPDFLLELEIEQVGGQKPGMREVRAKLEAWLNTLNADDIIRDMERGEQPPTLPVPSGDWLLSYAALPVKPEHRGENGRMLGMYMSSPGWQDNVGRIRKSVQDKGRKYSKLDAPLPYPLVVALNATTVFVDDEEIDRVLYGSLWSTYNPQTRQLVRGFGRLPDGYWREKPARGTRVAAVMMGLNINPYRVATATPRMWVNPWAAMPVRTTHSLATTTVTGEEKEIQRTKGDLNIRDLFGLPEGWPTADEKRQ